MSERMNITQQIAGFATRLEQVARDIAEIKAMLQQVDERVRALERSEAGEHPLLNSRIDAAWRRIEEHERKIEDIKQVVARLEHSNRLMAWLGGILGSTLVAWLLVQVLQLIEVAR